MKSFFSSLLLLLNKIPSRLRPMSGDGTRPSLLPLRERRRVLFFLLLGRSIYFNPLRFFCSRIAIYVNIPPPPLPSLNPPFSFFSLERYSARFNMEDFFPSRANPLPLPLLPSFLSEEKEKTELESLIKKGILPFSPFPFLPRVERWSLFFSLSSR